jgi:small-conductance mechanosensitive channel
VTWERIGIAVGVIAVAALAAKLVDMRISRRPLDPGLATRYRVLRRTISTTIVTVGVLSALLTIPEVRAAAGAVLASTAILGLVIGLAAQKTLSNFVAGILIAVSQPLRLGDRVAVEGGRGIVEEIGLTYTFIRLDDGARLVIPNDKLASDTIRNSTIRRVDTVAEIQVHVPLAQDVAAAVDALRDETAEYEGAQVVLSDLSSEAVVTVRVPATGARVEEVAAEVRLRAHARLRREGVFG